MTVGGQGEPDRSPWEVPPGGWRKVVDADVFGWILVDQDGVIRYYNQAVARMLGRSGGGALGTSMLDHLDPSEHGAALEALAELVSQDGEMSLVGLPMVFSAVHANGSTMPIEVGAGSHLDDPDLSVVRLRIRDYTPDDRLHAYLEALAQGASFPDLLHAAVRLADATLIGGSTAIVHDWDGESYRSWVTDTVDRAVIEAARWADPEALPWVQSRDGEARIVPCDSLVPELAAAAERAGFGSCWAEPITNSDDPGPSASLVIFRPWNQPPLVGHVAAARRLRSTLALAFRAQRVRAQLLAAATSDSLTGLANRSAAFDRLEQQLAVGPTAVLFVDLDGFKAINDVQGHGVGDDVLVEVAHLLRSTVEPDTVAARIGGDEFLVIVPGAPGVVALTALAGRLLASLGKPIAAGESMVEVGATIGIACAPEHGTTPDELVEAADRALYRAKRAGGRSWAVAYGDG